MNLQVLSEVCTSLILASCASPSSSVKPMAMSAYQYDHLKCIQIADEAKRVSSQAVTLTGAQDAKFARDAALTTVGLLVFWPALVMMPFVSGNDQETAELAKLRGEMVALEQVSARKQCGIDFQVAPPPPVLPVTKQDGPA